MAPFYDAANRNVLTVQRCTGCGALRFPAYGICSKCLSTNAEWVPVSGRGEVFSFNIMHQVYHPAFATEVPYAVVVVELEEGPRIISNLVGVKPHEIKCGMGVEVVFEKLNNQVNLPKFQPRASR